MKNVDRNSNANAFFRNLEPRFKSFKANIKKLAHKNKINFNEDVFMDTLIKCSNTFPNESATNKDVDNYFWIAFKQNSFSNFSRNKFSNTIKFDDFGDNILNDEYNFDIDEIVDLIKNEVKDKFGDEIYNSWILHVCNGYTYSELEKYGYEGLNLHNEFRQIKRYICQKFVNKNKKLKMLLVDNNLL
jgi:hypothetical protein